MRMCWLSVVEVAAVASTPPTAEAVAEEQEESC
jgi:hypothetical protein